MSERKALSENQSDEMQNASVESRTDTSDKSTKVDKIKGGRIAQLASMLEEKPLEEIESESELESESEAMADKEDPAEKSEDKDRNRQKVELKTFTDLAKKLGVEQARLYDIKLTLRDQETNVSIGELKDAYQESQDLDFQKIEWGETKAKEEQELARARKELEVLATLIPKDKLDKNNIEAAAKVVKAQLDRQRQDVLRRIPEWEDQEIRGNEVKGINIHLEKYGIKMADLTDSRLVHYIRNNWLREQRIEKALEKIRKVEKTKTPSPGSSIDSRTRKDRSRTVTPRARQIAQNLLNQLDED